LCPDHALVRGVIIPPLQKSEMKNPQSGVGVTAILKTSKWLCIYILPTSPELNFPISTLREKSKSHLQTTFKQSSGIFTLLFFVAVMTNFCGQNRY
jgi:hypothetical protein